MGRPAQPWEHGTRSGYKSHKCRCDECMDAGRRYRAENAAIIKAAKLDWYSRNRDRSLAVSKAYAQRRPDVPAASTRRWRQANPERAAAAAERRRARKMVSDVCAISTADWSGLVRRSGGRCTYCGSPSLKLTQDHVIPLSRGGRHAIGNLVPACQSCNSSKGSKLLIEWLAFNRSMPDSRKPLEHLHFTARNKQGQSLALSP